MLFLIFKHIKFINFENTGSHKEGLFRLRKFLSTFKKHFSKYLIFQSKLEETYIFMSNLKLKKKLKFTILFNKWTKVIKDSLKSIFIKYQTTCLKVAN